MKEKNGTKTISAIEAWKILDPDDSVLRHSSSIEDLTMEARDKVLRLRERGMTKKDIAKKIRKSDRYVAAVLKRYGRLYGLPNVMTPSSRKAMLDRIRKFGRLVSPKSRKARDNECA